MTNLSVVRAYRDHPGRELLALVPIYTTVSDVPDQVFVDEAKRRLQPRLHAAEVEKMLFKVEHTGPAYRCAPAG
ncbi:hypothetical protein GCM10023069_29680 [Shinella granuli]